MMKSFEILVALGLVMIGFFMLIPPAGAVNLVANPGFEAGTDSWYTWGGDIQQSSSCSHSGAYSCLTSNRTLAWEGAVQNMTGKMIGGSTYRISAWVKLQNAPADSVSISVRYTQNGQYQYWFAPYVLASDQDWVCVVGWFTVPTSFSEIDIYLTGPAAGVNFYVDDVTVESTYDAQHVGVDLSVPRAPVSYRASGFLFGVSSDDPSVHYFETLNPRLCRHRACTSDLANWGSNTGFTFPGFMDRIREAGAKSQIILSDEYMWEFGYHNSWGWPGDTAHDGYGPYDLLDKTITTIHNAAVAGGYSIEWDVWNEPDYYDSTGNYFWGRSQAQLFDCWKHAWNTIKQLEPSATVVGPSIAFFNNGGPGQYLKDFLTFCKANNCLPDILSWHEMNNYRDIPAQVSLMRSWMTGNGINPMPIDINECISESFTTLPGVYPWFYSSLEQATVNGAAHACWTDDDSQNTYLAGRLDGIMTSASPHVPRAAWHCCKAYADMSGNLVSVSPAITVNGVASKDDSSGQVTVLLGNDAGESNNIALEIDRLDTLNYVSKSGKVRMAVRRIPNTGSSALASSQLVSDTVMQISGNSLTVPVSMESYSAYVITLSNPSAPTGGLTINNDAEYTKSRSVRLILSPTNLSSPSVRVRLSNTGLSWTMWQPLRMRTKQWLLSPGDGTKKVYVQYEDRYGNRSSVLSDVIVLDTTAPTGSISIGKANGLSVTITAQASDNRSGVSQMRFSNDSISWSAWQPYAQSTSWTLAGAASGTKTVYAQFLDNAGNMSTTVSATILL